MQISKRSNNGDCIVVSTVQPHARGAQLVDYDAQWWCTAKLTSTGSYLDISFSGAVTVMLGRKPTCWVGNIRTTLCLLRTLFKHLSLKSLKTNKYDWKTNSCSVFHLVRMLILEDWLMFIISLRKMSSCIENYIYGVDKHYPWS